MNCNECKKESYKNNVNEIYKIIQLKLLNLLHNFALTGSLGHEKLLVLHG